MKKRNFPQLHHIHVMTHRILFLATALLIIGCSQKPSAENGAHEKDASAAQTASATDSAASARAAHDTADNDTLQAELPAGAKALLSAYPDFIIGYDGNELLFADGTRLTYDDGRKKNFEEMLDHSDAEDMFRMVYNSSRTHPGYLEDAGRSRCEKLFKKMYGHTADEVRKKLVKVDWLNEQVTFTSVNGAADSLRKVSAELRRHAALHKYLKSSGTFYWRKVRGAQRQSAHSYGIAFDIGVKYSDYWKWKNPDASETTRIAYANRIPKEIVRIFEKYGFIWGGAWYHYDTMHFEFRPEILRAANIHGNK